MRWSDLVFSCFCRTSYCTETDDKILWPGIVTRYCAQVLQCKKTRYALEQSKGLKHFDFKHKSQLQVHRAVVFYYFVRVILTKYNDWQVTMLQPLLGKWNHVKLQRSRNASELTSCMHASTIDWAITPSAVKCNAAWCFCLINWICTSC